jgi:hypothetical protein
MRTSLAVWLLIAIPNIAHAQYYGPTPRPYSTRTANSTPQYIPPPLPPRVYLPPAYQNPRPPGVILNPNPGYTTNPVYRSTQFSTPAPLYNQLRIYNSNPTYTAPSVQQPQRPQSVQPTYRSQPSFQGTAGRPPWNPSAPVYGSVVARMPIYSMIPKAGASSAQNYTSLYPNGLKFVSPVSSDEAWIIARESNWRTSAQNSGSTAFGLGQLLSGNRVAIAQALSQRLGYSVSPNTTDPNMQLVIMRVYIAQRYGTTANARQHEQQFRWY